MKLIGFGRIAGSTILIAELLATSPAHAGLDCARIWAAGFPVTAHTASFPCIKYADIPGPSGVSTLYYSSALSAADGSLDAVSASALQRIKQAVVDSAPVYQAFGNAPSAALVYTGLKNPSGRNAEVPFHHSVAGEPVALMIYSNTLSESPDFQKQMIAHELWHVFQYGNYSGGWAAPAAQWWVEGSADFFSNLVYPTVNREWTNAEAYSEDEPLYGQSRSYASTAFFQSLSNSWLGPQAAVDFQAAMPKDAARAADSAQQWQALASFPNIQMLFSDFARALTLSRIADTGGGVLPTHFVEPPAQEVPTAGSTQVITPKPFVVQETKFSLPAGYQWKLDVSTSVRNTPGVAYRREGQDTDWQDYYAPMPPSLDLSCRTQPKIVDLLLTSTSGPAQSAPQATVGWSSQQKDCPCKAGSPVAKALLGRWKMRDSSMKDFLSRALANGATVDNVSGTLLLTITDQHGFKYELDDVVVDAHRDDGTTLHIVANGAATLATVQAGDTHTMCLTDVTQDGLADVTLVLPGQPALGSRVPVQAAFEEGPSYAISLVAGVLTVDRTLPGDDSPVPLIFDAL